MSVIEDEIRGKTLQTAKSYKASWIELGRYLQTIYKDKMYKGWGFLAFETYCKKELGMKEAMASKIIKSFSFLETEEPKLTKPEFFEKENERPVPDLEALNTLRLAKNNKNIPAQEFAEMKESVLERGVGQEEIRAKVKRIVEESQDTESAEYKKTKRNGVLRRAISALGAVRKECADSKLIPNYLLEQIFELTVKLKEQFDDYGWARDLCF